MDDDTLINPDDIGSAEELRDLLVGLGFADVSIATTQDMELEHRHYQAIACILTFQIPAPLIYPRTVPYRTTTVRIWVQNPQITIAFFVATEQLLGWWTTHTFHGAIRAEDLTQSLHHGATEPR